MKVLYLDCSSGISGDMFIGAMLDAGLDFSVLQKELSKLRLKGYRLKKATTLRHSRRGTKFDVLIEEKRHDQRSLKSILSLIEKSGLNHGARELSKKIFLNIAKAESRAHNVRLEKVHFHQIGQVDSIIDIVGSAIAIRQMGIDRVYGSRLNLGKSEPATLNLLQGCEVDFSGIPYELVTPTGASIYRTLVEAGEMVPALKVERVGFGAGTARIDEIPNLLKVIVGEAKGVVYDEDSVITIETNIDDMKPVMYDYITERLFEAGALDVFITPTYTKKTRIGTLLTVLSKKVKFRQLVDIIFEETTTIGLRYYEAQRFILRRKNKKVKTGYGTINFKVSRLNNGGHRLSPEYNDCKRIARKNNIPLQRVYEEALAGEKRGIEG